MVCKIAVLLERLTTKTHHIANCLIYEGSTREAYNDNVCLSRALALHLHGNGRLEEETSKMLNIFPEKIGGSDPPSFQGVSVKD